MHKYNFRQIALALFLTLVPLLANSAGLGKLNVLSGLGEPLNAEIEILSASPDELASLNASIASEETYEAQGIERTSLHGLIKADVTQKAGGVSVVKLTTSQPVTEPFLDMLIQVSWSNGQLLREYTVLLDPPGYESQSISKPSVEGPKPNSDETELKSVNSSDNANQNKIPTNGKMNAKKKSTPSKQTVASDGSNTHRTVKGDSLSSIAKQNQVEGVNLDQMLVGLYKANRDAFESNNMNRLKVGQIIHVPTSDELKSISQEDAKQEVKAQSADWQSYREKLAGSVATASTAHEDQETNQSKSGKVVTRAEDKAASATSGPRDVVKLSKSDSTAAKPSQIDDSNQKEMQNKINALQEEISAKENSLKDSNERTALLEKQVQDLQKLITVRNQALSESQKEATVKQPDVNIPVPPPVEPPVQVSKPEVKQEVKPQNPKPVIKPEPPKNEPAAEPGMLDGIDPLLLSGAGIAITLLAGGWLYLRNKRKRGLDSLEQSILTSGGLKSNTVFGNTMGTGSGNTSFLTDFTQVGSGMIDTHDVDPIAEAEVYMAYGRDNQAEEILKDAISKDPKRYELHLKLLEVYAARKDSSAFETVAGELYSTLGSSHPIWAKAAEIGRNMEPNNPLYQGVNAPSEVSIDNQTPISENPSQDKENAVILSSKLESSDFNDAEVMSEDPLGMNEAESLPQIADFASENSDFGNVDKPLDFDLSDANEETLNDLPKVLEEKPALQFDDANSLDEPKLNDDQTLVMDTTKFGDSESMPPILEEFNDSEIKFESNDEKPFEEISMELPEINTGSEQNLHEPVIEDNISKFDLDLSGDREHLDLPELKLSEEINDSNSESDLMNFNLPESVESSGVAEELEESMSPQSLLKAKTIVNFNEIAENPLFKDDSTQIIKPAENLNTLDAVSKNEDLDIIHENSKLPTSVPELDLSGINLDLAAEDTSLSSEVPSNNEPSEVDTKLDLVAAYLDMGDKEGAKELLEEVVKEGGPHQRLRAQELLIGLA